MRLLLIRHGQTPSNVEGFLDTAAPGPGLTDLGLRQASRIPESLADEPIDGLYVSRLQRTVLTAQPLASARGLHPVLLPGVHEIEAAQLEMRRDRDAVRTYLETAFAWGLGDLTVRMPGGEDGHEFFGRFDESVNSVAEAGVGTAAIISHGAAIRVWVAGRARNVPPTYAGEHEIQNTGIVELVGTPDAGWTLVTWQGSPVGGLGLRDADAEDPTGESLDEALES